MWCILKKVVICFFTSLGQRKNWSESFHLDKSNMFRILSVTKLLDIYVTYALLILFFCFFSFFQVTQVLSTLTFIACVVLIGKHIFSLVRKVNNNNFTRITLTSFSVLSDSQYIINCQIFPVYKTWIRKSRMVFKERKIIFVFFRKQRVAYLKNFLNYVEWLCYVASIVYIFPTCDCKRGYKQEVGAVSVFFGWMNLILYFRR